MHYRAPSPPQLCLRWSTYNLSLLHMCITKKKDTLLQKKKKKFTKSLCRSSSQYIHTDNHKNIWLAWSPSTVPLTGERRIFDYNEQTNDLMLNETDELHNMHRWAVYCNQEISTECLGLILPFYMFSGLKRFIWAKRKHAKSLPKHAQYKLQVTAWQHAASHRKSKK